MVGENPNMDGRGLLVRLQYFITSLKNRLLIKTKLSFASIMH